MAMWVSTHELRDLINLDTELHSAATWTEVLDTGLPLAPQLHLFQDWLNGLGTLETETKKFYQ